MEEELRSGIETLKDIAEGAVPPEISIEEAKAILKRYKELEEENKRLNANLVYRKLQLTECIPISVIQNKRNEYLDFDKKHKTYTKDGRENFTMEYFKAKALDEILEKGNK